eukprot:478189-Pyramimonas_sp.AAC.1
MCIRDRPHSVRFKLRAQSSKLFGNNGGGGGAEWSQGVVQVLEFGLAVRADENQPSSLFKVGRVGSAHTECSLLSRGDSRRLVRFAAGREKGQVERRDFWAEPGPFRLYQTARA